MRLAENHLEYKRQQMLNRAPTAHIHNGKRYHLIYKSSVKFPIRA